MEIHKRNIELYEKKESQQSRLTSILIGKHVPSKSSPWLPDLPGTSGTPDCQPSAERLFPTATLVSQTPDFQCRPAYQPLKIPYFANLPSPFIASALLELLVRLQHSRACRWLSLCPYREFFRQISVDLEPHSEDDSGRSRLCPRPRQTKGLRHLQAHLGRAEIGSRLFSQPLNLHLSARSPGRAAFICLFTLSPMPPFPSFSFQCHLWLVVIFVYRFIWLLKSKFWCLKRCPNICRYR